MYLGSSRGSKPADKCNPCAAMCKAFPEVLSGQKELLQLQLWLKSAVTAGVHHLQKIIPQIFHLIPLVCRAELLQHCSCRILLPCLPLASCHTCMGDKIRCKHSSIPSVKALVFFVFFLKIHSSSSAPTLMCRVLQFSEFTCLHTR